MLKKPESCANNVLNIYLKKMIEYISYSKDNRMVTLKNIEIGIQYNA